MPKFSKFSKDNLRTCDAAIQAVMEEVIKHFDCRVIEGHRTEARQNALRAAGKSQLSWPDSRHNSLPSRAVDVIPYPVDWQDRERMTYFAGHVVAIGKMMGVELRWGGDWDSDTELSDNSFDDLAHFELR